MIDPFNKEMLLEKMQTMSVMARVAFASSCATRLFPTYECIQELDGTGDTVGLRAALNFSWNSVLANSYSEIDCKNQLQVVGKLVDASYTSENTFRLYAQDTTAIVAYSLRALDSGGVQEPVWAAQRIYEAVGRFIVTSQKLSLKGPKGLKGQELASLINNHPLMQLEFSRQFRDIEELSKGHTAEAIEIMMNRSEAEPALPFDLPIPSNLPSLSLVQIMLLTGNEYCM
ncbi:MAG: YjaG family protein [Candidatus Obscuribacterales bacterium]|jgi:hypothetical protein|nr:YjaG family protein [Candidatus Obscuribacterales bacterium]